ncbi:hypothetical protein [Kribbella sp. NPDC051770]|uniref:hypothetical protein n=1 Tax=Kribbella sp. NPDC051770 TaxID=3155413 RepID=UPI00341A1943
MLSLIGRALLPSYFPSSVWGSVIFSVLVGPCIALSIRAPFSPRGGSGKSDES